MRSSFFAKCSKVSAVAMLANRVRLACRTERVEQRMTIKIACVEDPTLEISIEGQLPAYNNSTHEFRLNRPIGDDWLQFIRYVPKPPPVLVLTEGDTALVVFETRNAAVRFEEWLREAREEQNRGLKTMRG